MADWGHGAAAPPEQENERASAQRSRLGLWLFGLYLLLYAGFMALNAFAPDEMDYTPFAGVNIAVLYGLALILIAFVLALIYDALCRGIDSRGKDREGDR